jgi:hypothetical protein
VTVCLDEMGPESAKTVLGTRLVHCGERAVQEIDYGRRGKGYIFGAFQPATGAAFTETYGGRTMANFIDFWRRWIPGSSLTSLVYAPLSLESECRIHLYETVR